MIQIIEENRRPTAGERANKAVGVGLEAYQNYQKKNRYDEALKLAQEAYNDPNLKPEQKFLKAFSAMREFPEAAKQLTSGISQFSESPLQSAQRRKIEQELTESQGEEGFLSRIMSGGQMQRGGQEKETAPFGWDIEEQDGTEIITPKKGPKFDMGDSSTWSDAQIRQFRAYKGKSPKMQSLARMADLEQENRKELGKTREKTEKSAKDQKAIKQLLRESKKFDSEEELEEASKIYDLPTAKSIWQESKKPKSKSTTQKLLETETAKGYIAAKNEIPKLQATLENINRLKELGPKLGGPSGYVKSAFNTQSAAEYNTLGASLLDPVIKIFNPVGAVPVTKLNWIRDTFSPKASDLQTTQAGKLATLERLASQAQQRAQQKIKLFEDYNGEPPESEVVKFDNDSAKMVNDFVDNQQYVEKLKKEVPKGKILMIDPNGKPLHVDPSQTMPNGMTAVEYATQFGAKVIE